MSDRNVGWAFVAAQAVLLVTIIVLPGADHWPTPTWIDVAGNLLFAAGVALAIVAASGLGSALTPTPVPTAAGALTTSGLYRYMRHPIYTGVLVLIAGLTVRSGSLAILAVAIITVAFFTVKAVWEERRLADRYTDYAEYASRTPRFMPGVRGRSPGDGRSR